MRRTLPVLVVSAGALVGAASIAAQRADAVRIRVTEDRIYGRAAYRYVVENNTRDRAIVAFRIGDDSDGVRAELSQPPYGWTDEKGLPIGSAFAPDGWGVEAVREEEDARWFVEWFVAEPDDSLEIAAGQMRDGFATIVADAAPEYLAGHWTVVFDNGDRASGRLEVDSTR